MKTMVFITPYTTAEQIQTLAHTAQRLQQATQVCVLAETIPEQVLALDVTSILHCSIQEEATLFAQVVLPTLAQLQQTQPANLLLFDDGAVGQELSTRLAVRCGIQAFGQVIQPEWTAEGIGFFRDIYGENLRASYAATGSAFCLSVKTQDLDPVNRACTPSEVIALPLLSTSKSPITLLEATSNDQENPLLTANRVLAIGRGCSSPEALQGLEALSKSLQAELGGTRPAALDGYCPLNRMIGISGHRLKADLCLVLGASGATPFLRGIQKCQTIIGINNQPSALLFDNCDYALVGDCAEAIGALLGVATEMIGDLR